MRPIVGLSSPVRGGAGEGLSTQSYACVFLICQIAQGFLKCFFFPCLMSWFRASHKVPRDKVLRATHWGIYTKGDSWGKGWGSPEVRFTAQVRCSENNASLMSVLLWPRSVCPLLDFAGLVGQRLGQRAESSRAGGHPGHQIFSHWQAGLPAGQERLRPETPPAPEALGCACYPGRCRSSPERWGSPCSLFSLELERVDNWWLLQQLSVNKGAREAANTKKASSLCCCAWYPGILGLIHSWWVWFLGDIMLCSLGQWDQYPSLVSSNVSSQQWGECWWLYLPLAAFRMSAHTLSCRKQTRWRH